MVIEQKEQSTKERSILVMEDNEDMLSFLTEQLGKTYEVFTANNGKDGFELAIQQVPDLIISDVFMPEADGLTTTKRLKDDLRTSHIPVVLLTARSSHEQRLEGLGTMADAYLTKPFNLEVLQATLHNMLTNRELLKQKFTSELPSAGNKEVGKIDKKFINDLASIVEANLANENLSVEEISLKIGLSRVQLYRKVKALLNSSVAEYILNRRLQKARYMLLNEPDLSISEITFKTGFTSPNYFATVFKANYQCTPSDFRKNA
ncbi:Response regulator PleD [compost metagenome]